jgi:leucyl aminopeptidase
MTFNSRILLAVFSLSILFHLKASPDHRLILSEASRLEALKINPLYKDEESGLAIARISSLQESLLIRKSHQEGRCGAFELLGMGNKSFARNDFQEILEGLKQRQLKDSRSMKSYKSIAPTPQIRAAVEAVSGNNIQEWVKWLSAYPTRFHRAPEPNKHVVDLQKRLDQMLAVYPHLGASTELVEHKNTPQKTLVLRIPGKSSSEIVGMGAHLDSINSGFIGMPTNRPAPGADDDASGSATLLEALRILLPMAPFNKSVEFFWYAGEEGGLIGSAEIAADYKTKAKNVVGVLQLDMTLFAGSGANNIASMTDFTTPSLRALLNEINEHYLGVNIIEDKCGYGCSDHASWYRNGFPTLMPTEATFRQMNKKIHTSDDVINASSSFDHSVIFGKIAVAFASHLAD